MSVDRIDPHQRADLSAAIALMLQKHERAVLFFLRTPPDDVKYDAGAKYHRDMVKAATIEVVDLIIRGQ